MISFLGPSDDDVDNTSVCKALLLEDQNKRNETNIITTTNTTTKKFEAIADKLATADDFSHQTLETVVKTYITDNGLKMGEIMPVLRLALAGTMQGPTIFDMMALLGKEKSVARIKKSLNYFDTI